MNSKNGQHGQITNKHLFGPPLSGSKYKLIYLECKEANHLSGLMFTPWFPTLPNKSNFNYLTQAR